MKRGISRVAGFSFFVSIKSEEGKMANLKVTIVVRATTPEGRRSWVVANGKTDPPGVYYLRHCGSGPGASLAVVAALLARESAASESNPENWAITGIG